MLFWPLSWVPLDVLARLWIVLSLVLLARVCLLLVRRPARHAGTERRDALVVLCAAMLAEPLSSTLGYGQVNVLLLWLVVEDLLGARRPRRGTATATGVLTGVAAGIKVTPLLLSPTSRVVGRCARRRPRGAGLPRDRAGRGGRRAAPRRGRSGRQALLAAGPGR